jgi:hypothetical protein
MMTREQKHTIDVYLNALGGNGASKINGHLNEIAQTADKLPESAERSTILDVTLQAHAVNNFDGKTLADFQAWNNAQEVEEPEPPVTQPPPTSGSGPIDPIPNDGVTRRFGPMTQGTVYTTHAGGDGKFSFSTSSGNAYHQAWVNGKLAIDGGMSEVPVKAGDEIRFAITTGTQGTCTYSILNR